MQRKGTSVAQPDGTGVLLAGAESPPAHGATRSAPSPSDSAGPGPGRPHRGRSAGAPRSTSNYSSKSLCPNAPGPWPGEPGGPPPVAGRAGATEQGEQPVPAPGPFPAGLRRSLGSPQCGTRSDAAGMSTDRARSPDRRVRAGAKESKVSAQTRRDPRAAGRPESAAAAGPAPGAPPPCAHPAGPQPREVCAAGPARGPSGGQPPVLSSGGRGAGRRVRRGLAQAAPGRRRLRRAPRTPRTHPVTTGAIFHKLSPKLLLSRERPPPCGPERACAGPRDTRGAGGGGAVRTAHSAPGLLPADTTARAWEPHRSRESLAPAGMRRAAQVSRERRALRGNRGIPSAHSRVSPPPARGGEDGEEPFGARREGRGGAAASASGRHRLLLPPPREVRVGSRASCCPRARHVRGPETAAAVTGPRGPLARSWEMGQGGKKSLSNGE